MTYDEARPWAKAMREEVLERRMPPWGAVEGVGAFRENPSLTPLEIEILVSWVEGGAPEGDAVYLPATPEFEPAEAHRQECLATIDCRKRGAVHLCASPVTALP